MTRQAGSARASAWILPAAAPVPPLFGVPAEERLRRALAAAGVERIALGDPAQPELAGHVVILRSDWVFDPRLVEALVASPDLLLASRDGRPVAAHVPAERRAEVCAALAGPGPRALPTALRVAGPDALVPAWSHALRKRDPALLEPVREATARDLERRLFAASYKGTTDFVTKYVWPPLALPAVRACARAGISPNGVTLASWALVGLALWGFAAGHFGPGLAAAWLMTFLDTVDGKLARVTLRSSRIGHVLDHGLDIVHPPFWYAAWGLALAPAPWLDLALAAAVGGYVVHRLVEGLFLAAFGIEIHAWRRLDARFRLVTTRRNPNLVLLTAGWAAGRPDLGFAAVAAWTGVSILFHLVRVAQAGVEALRGRPVRAWYEAEAREAGEDAAGGAPLAARPSAGPEPVR